MENSYKIISLGVFFVSLTLGAIGSFSYQKTPDGQALRIRLVDGPVTFGDRVRKTGTPLVIVEPISPKKLTLSSLRRLSPVSPGDSVDDADDVVASEDLE